MLREDCLVWGPNTGLGRPVCVECLCDVQVRCSPDHCNPDTDSSPQGDTSCPECGCPLCPTHLSAHPLHDTECRLLRGLEINTEDMDPVHNIIEVIRWGQE